METKQYRINPAHLHEWGNDVDENTVIDESELNRLASEWKGDDESIQECKARLLNELEEI